MRLLTCQGLNHFVMVRVVVLSLVFVAGLSAGASAQGVETVEPTSQKSKLVTAGQVTFAVSQFIEWDANRQVKFSGGVTDSNLSLGNQALVKGAVTLGAVYLSNKIARKHPKLAAFALFTLSGMTLSAAQNNYRLAMDVRLSRRYGG